MCVYCSGLCLCVQFSQVWLVPLRAVGGWGFRGLIHLKSPPPQKKNKKNNNNNKQTSDIHDY